MSYVRPRTADELLQARASHPEWPLVAGGTDLMVPANFGRSRPPGLVDLTDVGELAELEVSAEGVRIGSGVTFARLEHDRRPQLAGLATAARAVASPQIRSTATVGGNIGTASPAGDAHPMLVAADGVLELRSVRGRREVPYLDYFLAPGRSVLEPDEVVWSVWLPSSARSSQHFSKVGTRNAMVISVAAVGLVVDWERRTVGVGLGSVGPRPLRAREAELYLAEQLWESPGATPDVDRFAELVSAAATPIDDLRGTADYRRHVVGVMAGRTLSWALKDSYEVGA